eukprot:CAMPEP_0119571404 /NCGR_PEP_ID=MMETSP1352-20130426/44092_1 /TAXON_ID=265584 /ORGANISM="Stauroneis constricta, Strain CCMP1120" /LENGTH=638 /DNA_ID=CAMNT_0007621083 /DNA_START=620 /DNA_END=2537 /DNA_ORIENTATION=+
MRIMHAKQRSSSSSSRKRNMTPIKTAITVWVTAVIATSSAFQPHHRHCHHAAMRSATSNSNSNRVLFMSTTQRQQEQQQKDEEEEETEATTTDHHSIPADHLTEQSTIIDALSKQLERQKADIAITENLLERLHHPDSNAISYITSITKGFNYGFQSRNEGSSSASNNNNNNNNNTLMYGPPSNIVTLTNQQFWRNWDAMKGEQQQQQLMYGPPSNIVTLTNQQFWRNWDAMKGEYKDEDDVTLTKRQQSMQEQLELLTLNSTAIWERELADSSSSLDVAPWIIKAPYLVLCYFLDTVFEDEYVPARFFYLETVARMPYFSYITMLHLYETLGFWRRSADVKRIHFAEEINEYRHLLIMESLGGDQQWWVRFLAQHSSIVYFVVLCTLFLISPTLSYKFSDLLETHAVHTYGQFLDENEERLKELPPPLPAVEYYTMGISDPFYAEFQTSAMEAGRDIRRPGAETPMQSLHDVFTAVRADEGDHVATMQACLDPTVAVQSPSIERRVLIGLAMVAIVGAAINVGGDAGLLDSAVGSLSSDLATASDSATTASNVAAASAGTGLEETAMVDAVGAAVVAGMQRVMGEDAGQAVSNAVASTATKAAEAVDEAAMSPEAGAFLRKVLMDLFEVAQRIFFFL